jgi:hypothetical protein
MTHSARVRTLAILGVTIVAMGLAGGAAAQTSTATLQGTITDASGAVLPGAVVKLQSVSMGLSREAVTNVAGVYVFNFLPAGGYAVTAELSGFKTTRHDQIRLEVGQNLELDLLMEIGQLAEIVNVEATAPLLDRSSPSIGTVI